MWLWTDRSHARTAVRARLGILGIVDDRHLKHENMRGATVRSEEPIEGVDVREAAANCDPRFVPVLNVKHVRLHGGGPHALFDPHLRESRAHERFAIYLGHVGRAQRSADKVDGHLEGGSLWLLLFLLAKTTPVTALRGPTVVERNFYEIAQPFS